MRAMVAPLVGSARTPAAFVREVGAGIASFARPGSPLNKLIGAGLDGSLDERLLDDRERAFREAGEPVRIGAEVFRGDVASWIARPVRAAEAAYTAGGDSPDSTGSRWICLSRGRTVKL